MKFSNEVDISDTNIVESPFMFDSSFTNLEEMRITLVLTFCMVLCSCLVYSKTIGKKVNMGATAEWKVRTTKASRLEPATKGKEIITKKPRRLWEK